MAFPIAVAVKNIPNGIRKWPQVIPAKSNNGFGILFKLNFETIESYK